MTRQHDDFFAALGTHLDQAAERQARRGRLALLPRPSALAAPAIALAVVLLAVLSVTGGLLVVREDAGEVAATPAPQFGDGWTSYAPIVDCRSEQAPTPVAVLRRPRTDADREADRLWGDRGQLGNGKVWPAEGRIARRGVSGDHAYAVYPAVLNCRDDDQGEIGVCLLRGVRDEVMACWTISEITQGESVLPGDEAAALVPDDVGNAEIVAGDRRLPGTAEGNVVVAAEAIERGRWKRLDAPEDYGCDGPVHPGTLAAYAVLRDEEPDPGVTFKAPDGITFLSGPVHARSAFGQSFWLIPAAAEPDCGTPLICVATEFGSPQPACGPVSKDRSAPIATRIEPDGEPNLIVFAAAPDGTRDQRFRGLDLDFDRNLVVAGGKLPEDEARRIAERVAGGQVP